MAFYLGSIKSKINLGGVVLKIGKATPTTSSDSWIYPYLDENSEENNLIITQVYSVEKKDNILEVM